MIDFKRISIDNSIQNYLLEDHFDSYLNRYFLSNRKWIIENSKEISEIFQIERRHWGFIDKTVNSGIWEYQGVPSPDDFLFHSQRLLFHLNAVKW